MWTVEENPERAILIGLARSRRDRWEEEESLLELRELVRSAGGVPVHLMIQERPDPDPAFFIGAGKLEELRAEAFGHDASLVVFDDELSPAQQRNLEKHLELKVIDRSGLILDIFAQRARSREGKLQVELALLEYRLPRLAGRGEALSRLGGGIGTRGPGETRLEADRRVVRRRIARVKQELDRLEERRRLHRQKRSSVPVPTLSLVGYTNAGKSTLFNALTSERTRVSPQMFATLDPLVRRLSLPSGQEVLLSDTVGFIRKLPHTLIAAFEATLEETVAADLLLHVIDVSDANWPKLAETVHQVLGEVGAGDVPVLRVYNKIDQIDGVELATLPAPGIAVSASTGAGLDRLLAAAESAVSQDYQRVTLLVPFERGDIVSALRERGKVESTHYRARGTELELYLRRADLGRYAAYVVGKDPEGSSE